MNPIQEAYRALAGAIAVLAIVAGLYLLGKHNGAEAVLADWDKEKLVLAQAVIEADQQARDKENDWQEKWKGAVNERTELEIRLEVARSAAAAADGRLRRAASDFQRRLSEASVETCRKAAVAAAGLLGECSAAYRDLAGAADGHLADLRQCEAAWPG